jgi:phosphoglycolate phosphatase-like HAD superfamily hydrolase
MRRVHLFDVDGTLVRSGGAGIRALGRAFEELYGAQKAMEGVALHGRTDYAICREAFTRALGRTEVSRPEIARLLEAYVCHLEREVRTSSTFEVLPGAVALLEELAARGDLLGLATGNIERGARLKIARGDLNRFFGFGGFGEDAEDRAELVRRARSRAEGLLREDGGDLRVYVIGDTELDVRAAQAAGCIAVAVATGLSDEASLRRSGARYVFRTLEEARGRPPFA